MVGKNFLSRTYARISVVYSESAATHMLHSFWVPGAGFLLLWTALCLDHVQGFQLFTVRELHHTCCTAFGALLSSRNSFFFFIGDSWCVFVQLPSTTTVPHFLTHGKKKSFSLSKLNTPIAIHLQTGLKLGHHNRKILSDSRTLQESL